MNWRCGLAVWLGRIDQRTPMRWDGFNRGAVIPGSTWRSLTGTPFGGVSWRCQLAVSVGGVTWLDANPPRIDKRPSMRWHGSAEGAVIAGSAWRSLTGTPFGGVSWRTGLAERLGGATWRSDLAEWLGRMLIHPGLINALRCDGADLTGGL